MCSMKDWAKYQTSVLLSLRSQVKQSIVGEDSILSTWHRTCGCSNTSRQLWQCPQNTILSTERYSPLGNDSIHSNSKTLSVEFMHGEHFESASSGLQVVKVCEKLRNNSRETWTGLISASGYFSASYAVNFKCFLQTWLLNIKHETGNVSSQQGRELEGGTCLGPKYKPFYYEASVQTVRSWELPRLPESAPPFPMMPIHLLLPCLNPSPPG